MCQHFPLHSLISWPRTQKCVARFSGSVFFPFTLPRLLRVSEACKSFSNTKEDNITPSPPHQHRCDHFPNHFPLAQRDKY